MQATTTAVESVTERRRMEAVVETLAAMHHGESLAELAHDARNMVTALSLYCDLLEEPGVLSAPHRHYGSELRLVAEASRRLVEKLALLEAGEEPAAHDGTRLGIRLGTGLALQGQLFPETPAFASPLLAAFPRIWAAAEPGSESRAGIPSEAFSAGPSGALIDDFRAELLSIRNLLAAIAGPSITVTATADGGAWPVLMAREDLIRALVNLVKNAAESIAGPGTIQLGLEERRDGSGAVGGLVLLVEDSGRGIPEEFLEKVFEPGFTTRAVAADGRWISGHRGLGLSIVRSIAEAAGGRMYARNRTAGEGRKQAGACFVIELPVRT
jgi:signal transduction histidine kinase